jgi:hypothetical protein
MQYVKIQFLCDRYDDIPVTLRGRNRVYFDNTEHAKWAGRMSVSSVFKHVSRTVATGI